MPASDCPQTSSMHINGPYTARQTHGRLTLMTMSTEDDPTYTAELPDGTKLFTPWTSKSGRSEMTQWEDKPDEVLLLLGGDQDEASADLDEYLGWAKAHGYPCGGLKFDGIDPADPDHELVRAYREATH